MTATSYMVFNNERDSAFSKSTYNRPQLLSNCLSFLAGINFENIEFELKEIKTSWLLYKRN